MKKNSLVLMTVLFCLSITMAQRTVTCTVINDNSKPLIGSFILVKGIFGTSGATTPYHFLVLNPNSIAEISTLKSLSAADLYGEAEPKGVVSITTKNGQSDGSSKRIDYV